MSVLTKDYEGLVEAVATECVVFSPDHAEGEQPKAFVANMAVWDTGATNTIITPEIVEKLGLKPAMTGGLSGIGGDVESGIYKINLGLPGGILVYDVPAFVSDQLDDYEMLIGMDVILLGDFCLSNKDDRTVFSFRIPTKEHIILED